MSEESRYLCPYCHCQIPTDAFMIHRNLCSKIHGKKILILKKENLCIGDIVIIADGQSLARSSNPEGTTRVKIEELRDYNFRGRAISENGNVFTLYSYDYTEIIEISDSSFNPSRRVIS